LHILQISQQLRGAQILDAVRLHKQGFPKFLPLSEFRRRFRLLAPADGRPASPVLDERRAVEDMLLGIDVDMASCRVGLSQVGTNFNFCAKFGLKSLTNIYVEISVQV
jgi:myosin-18